MYQHLKRWQCPRNFMIGPQDEAVRLDSYLILGRHRDSSLLGNINYIVMLEKLRQKEEELGGAQDETPWVWGDRDSHWACGWVECIYLRADAPPELLQYADDLLESLAQYPVLDEERYSAAQFNAVQDYWDGATHEEKLALIVKQYEVGKAGAKSILRSCGFPGELRDAMYDWDW